MAATPKFKVYRDGVFVASFKDATDAGAFVSTFCSNGSQVRLGHSIVLFELNDNNRCMSCDEIFEAMAAKAPVFVPRLSVQTTTTKK
jgi:hypothetical protein